MPAPQVYIATPHFAEDVGVDFVESHRAASVRCLIRDIELASVPELGYQHRRRSRTSVLQGASWTTPFHDAVRMLYPTLDGFMLQKAKRARSKTAMRVR